MVPVQRYLVFGNHSSRTAARIYWVGIRSGRSRGVGTAVATPAAAAAAVAERVDGRSIGSMDSARGDIDHNHGQRRYKNESSSQEGEM